MLQAVHIFFISNAFWILARDNSESRPGTRSFSSFSSAVSEVADARVFGGIHFRTSCDLGNTLGRAVANFVATHAMRLQE
jgi:hypothetical protein